MRVGPDRRARLEGANGELAADLQGLFVQAEQAVRSSNRPHQITEWMRWHAQWLTQCGQHEQAAAALRQLVEEQQRQWTLGLAAQVQELEELGSQRLAEQALMHAREREALQASRLTVLERNNAMLEMLDGLSRHLHATTDAGGLFENLRQHALPIIGGSELRAWVLDADGAWSAWFGVDDAPPPADALRQLSTGGQYLGSHQEQPLHDAWPHRLLAPLYDQGRHVGLLAVDRRSNEASPAGLNRLEQQRVFGLIADHVSIALQNALRQRHLQSASDHAQRQAQDERHGRERAEQLVEDKRRFLAQASHDLRTPLNAVLGFSQLLEAAASPNQERERAWAQHIMKAGKQLTGLVEDILDLSRMDAGVLTLNLEDVDLRTEASRCIQMLQIQAERAGISLAVAQAEAEAVLARTDRARLQQILVNLVSNGIKYNSQGGSVQVTLRAEAGAVRLDVDDNGLGVPEGTEGGLFEPFNRLGRQNTKIQGTGLGLSVVHRLAVAMGGRVEHQRLVPGSRFTVWLPEARATGVVHHLPRD